MRIWKSGNGNSKYPGLYTKIDMEMHTEKFQIFKIVYRAKILDTELHTIKIETKSPKESTHKYSSGMNKLPEIFKNICIQFCIQCRKNRCF